MFTLKAFIKRGFIAAVGKMADYQIILNAGGQPCNLKKGCDQDSYAQNL